LPLNAFIITSKEEKTKTEKNPIPKAKNHEKIPLSDKLKIKSRLYSITALKGKYEVINISNKVFSAKRIRQREDTKRNTDDSLEKFILKLLMSLIQNTFLRLNVIKAITAGMYKAIREATI